MAKAPLIFTYYIAAPMEKVWDGFVSKEALVRLAKMRSPSRRSFALNITRGQRHHSR